MNEINDFLLNLCTGNDRPSLLFPNVVEDYVYASDAVIMVRIPKNQLSLKYNYNEKFPDVKKVMERIIEKCTNSVDVKVSDLVKELAKMRAISDSWYESCRECKGSMEVKWEYFSKVSRKYYYEDNDCPVCKGSGTSDIISPFYRLDFNLNKDDTVNAHIHVGKLLFGANYLYKLTMFALLKGQERITINYSDNLQDSVIQIGDIEIIIKLIYQYI